MQDREDRWMAMDLLIYVARQFGIKEYFLDEVASSKLNLHGGLFRKCGHLGLFEATPTCVIHGLADTPSFVSGLNAWIVVWC